jgi:hypothetical protein
MVPLTCPPTPGLTAQPVQFDLSRPARANCFRPFAPGSIISVPYGPVNGPANHIQPRGVARTIGNMTSTRPGLPSG